MNPEITRTERDAAAAWALVRTFRFDDNWGRAVSAANKLMAYRRAPNPFIRRLAFAGAPPLERIVA